jgi:hypothetical protein
LSLFVTSEHTSICDPLAFWCAIAETSIEQQHTLCKSNVQFLFKIWNNLGKPVVSGSGSLQRYRDSLPVCSMGFNSDLKCMQEEEKVVHSPRRREGSAMWNVDNVHVAKEILYPSTDGC